MAIPFALAKTDAFSGEYLKWHDGPYRKWGRPVTTCPCGSPCPPTSVVQKPPLVRPNPFSRPAALTLGDFTRADAMPFGLTFRRILFFNAARGFFMAYFLMLPPPPS